jgi:hypothetical protein
MLFLVEPESGQRCHYSSARALGVAIRRGELGPQAKIFHQTSNQWLPISVHPEYRRAEADWEEGSARQLRARRWTFLSQPPVESETPLESERSVEKDRPAADSPAPDYPGMVPILVPGEGETSWLGSAVRHLLQLARPGI